MSMLSDESEDEVENIDPYRRKYQLLSERCEVLQQDNERLAFRTQETRKQRNKLRRLRKAIMDRLDKYGDGWRTAPLMIPDPAARTVVKTEKIPPKLSPPKGVPMQKTKTAFTPTSEKSAQKSSKNAASGSNVKRKSTSKAEKLEHGQNIVLKHPNNPFFVFCDDDQPPLMSMEQRHLEHEASDIELNKHLGGAWNTPTTDETKMYYNVYEQFKEQNVSNMDMYKGEIPSTTST